MTEGMDRRASAVETNFVLGQLLEQTKNLSTQISELKIEVRELADGQGEKHATLERRVAGLESTQHVWRSNWKFLTGFATFVAGIWEALHQGVLHLLKG